MYQDGLKLGIELVLNYLDYFVRYLVLYRLNFHFVFPSILHMMVGAGTPNRKMSFGLGASQCRQVNSGSSGSSDESFVFPAQALPCNA